MKSVRGDSRGESEPILSLRPLTERQVDLTCLLFVAFVGFALYATTAVPGPFDGDHGEFQYMSRVLGLPHPTGYPTYLITGWLWSWLPLGTMAFRLNLFSAFWASFTLVLLFAVARQQGLKRVAALGGTTALALAPAFWRYAGLAAVYTLHTALLLAALACWLRWSAASGSLGTKWLWAAAFFTGLALTNHPTAAFLVPAATLFLLLHGLRWRKPRAKPNQPVEKESREGLSESPRVRAWVVAAGLLVLPGLLYFYVPLRLWSMGPGVEIGIFQENVAKGRITPFVIDWTAEGILDYVTGRSFLPIVHADWSLLWTVFPKMLVEHFGLPLVVLGLVGSVLWLVRRTRSWMLLAALFLPAAAYAASYDVELAALNQVGHLEGHLLPALLVFAVWIAQGASSGWQAALQLTRRPPLANALSALLLVIAFGVNRVGEDVPTAADREQSLSITHYWTEILAYPLEQGGGLTGHWGDLRAFWYFQNGEGLRPDLWAIFPPTLPFIEAWLAESGRPLYLAGPLLEWSPDLFGKYDLMPFGSLVRIAPKGSSSSFLPMLSQTALFGGRLELKGYTTLSPTAEGGQIRLAWQTTAPTSRDLSVSVRLHERDGKLLLQQDGRLASLWFPRAMLPQGQPILTAFDLEFPEDLPPDAAVRIVA